MKKLYLDLTAFVRAPESSVGLCALRLFRALKNSKELKLETQAVSRVWSKDFSWMSAWTKFFGYKNSLYHSVDPVLSPLQGSLRIMTVHDCWTLQRNPWQAPEFQEKQSKKFIQSLDRADRIVTPSHYTREKLLEWNSSLEGRVFTIPWGPIIDGSVHLGAASSSGASVGVAQYLNKKRPYFLCVANLEFRKNHSLLLKAFSFVNDYDLVLVANDGYGAAEIRREIESAQGQGTSVVLFSHLGGSDLASLYRQARAVVLPSHEEGFGLPALEAMHFSKPLIASQIDPFLEIAQEAALYFDPEKGFEELREHLIRIASDDSLAEDLSRKAANRISLFSWDLCARSHAKLYQEMLK